MNLYKQYIQVKKEHPNELVFFRVGDFYELYAQDAIKASELLDLTLTGRDFGLTERVPMCGVPQHSVNAYITKLFKDGHDAAICEGTRNLSTVNNEIIPAHIQPERKLNLTATKKEQTVLLEYLEQNASEILIEKINNGVKVVKDGKTLISKKTLETFMKYALDEAQRQAEKGVRGTCIEDKTVFGWLIHYFEEDSIEGTLYNEDGTEYTPPKPVRKATKTTTTTVSEATPTAPVVKPKTQFSLFDMLEPQTAAVKEPITEAEPVEDETTADEIDTDTDEADVDIGELENNISDPPEDEEEKIPTLTQISETEYVDGDGIIYSEVPKQPQDKELSTLLDLFGGTLVAR